jgi:hypothetical protein
MALAKYPHKFVKLLRKETCATEITLKRLLFSILFIYGIIHYELRSGDKK